MHTMGRGSRRVRAGIAVLIALELLAAALVAVARRGDGGTGDAVASCPLPRVAPVAPAWRDGTRGAKAGFSPGAGIFGDSDAELDRELRAMASLGIRWLRLDVDWSYIGRERGRLDFCATDRVVVAARAAGLDVIALPTYTPEWARPAGSTDKHPPTDPRRYGDFVAAAVARYRPIGVTVYELWNEPNIPAFWSPRPDPVGYAALLQAGAAGARRAAPDVVVLSGGLAPASDDADSGAVAPETFLRALYDEGAGPAFDGVAVHPYSYPALPLDPATAAWNPFLRLGDLTDVVRGNGDRDKGLWLTEFGAPTGTARGAVTEAVQATSAQQALSGALDRPDVAALLWYSYRDAGTSRSDREDNFGLVRRDFDAKPALDAFRQVAAARPGAS